jgi:hypothetical protein
MPLEVWRSGVDKSNEISGAVVQFPSTQFVILSEARDYAICRPRLNGKLHRFFGPQKARASE